MPDTIDIQLQDLRKQVGHLAERMAALETLCKITSEGVERGHKERGDLWVEIRGYGEKLVGVTNELKGLTSGVAELKPIVTNLQIERAAITGGLQAGGFIAHALKFAAGILIGAGTAIIAMLSWLQQRQ